MATFTGSSGVVTVSAATVAEITGFNLDVSRGLVDNTPLVPTGSAKTFLPEDAYEWGGTLECMWDDSDSTGQEALLTACTGGTTVTLHFLPEGTTTGDEDYTGTCYVESVGMAVAKNSTITRSIQVKGSGALTITTAA